MKFIAVLLLVLVATAASEPRFHDHIIYPGHRFVDTRGSFNLLDIFRDKNITIKLENPEDRKYLTFYAVDMDSSYAGLFFSAFDSILNQTLSENITQYVLEYTNKQYTIKVSPFQAFLYANNTKGEPIPISINTHRDFNYAYPISLCAGLILNIMISYFAGLKFTIYSLSGLFAVLLSTIIIVYFILSRMNVNNKSIAVISTLSSVGITTYFYAMMKGKASEFITANLKYISIYIILTAGMGVALAYYYMPKQRDSKGLNIWFFTLKGFSYLLILNSSSSCTVSLTIFLLYNIISFFIKHRIYMGIPNLGRKIYYLFRYYRPKQREYLSSQEANRYVRQWTDDGMSELLKIYRSHPEKIDLLSPSTQEEIRRCLRNEDYYDSLITKQDMEYSDNSS